MLPLAQSSFDRPSEEHRHVIWLGGNVNIMFRKMEAEVSTVSSCLGRQERSRDTGKLRNPELCSHVDYKTTTLLAT